MELPIVITFEKCFMSLQNQDLEDRIRILDIDGIYLVSVTIVEKKNEKFWGYSERAFNSLFEAQSYLIDDLGIDCIQETNEWRDYEHE